MRGRVLIATSLAAALAPLAAGAAPAGPQGTLLAAVADGSIATLDVGTGRLHRVATGSDASWSPDGRKIAFVRSGPDAKSELFVVEADGRQARQLTHDDLRQREPVWSPDGTRIAFLQMPQQLLSIGRPPNEDVIAVRADGSAAAQLTHDNLGKNSLSWSPDGARLAFRQRLPAAAVTVVGADGSGERDVVSAGFDPAWSPNGLRLAFVAVGTDGGLELETAAPDGSAARVLVHVGRNGDLASPAWSPDGRRLAFVYFPIASCCRRLELVDVRTGRLRGLTPARGHVDSGPRWSPAGRWLAFTRGSSTGSRRQVALIRPDGTGLRLLRSPRAVTVLAWRPHR